METLTYTGLASFEAVPFIMFKGEAALRSNGNSENRSDSPKELPSKINRQRRSTERRELSQALKFDENHISTCTSPLNKPMTTTTKCAGTQTVLSTVKEYPNSHCLHSMTTLPESAIGEPRTGTINPAVVANNNNNNHPALTMTTSTQQMMRPSVIACAPPPQVVRENNANAARNSNGEFTSSTKGNQRREVTCATGMCDPAIDEHFRRSLGEDYKEEYWSSKPSNAISITGTVDDHFAQALGEKWIQMQNPEAKNHETQSASPKPNNHVNLQRSMVSI
ncbi:transcription cofactor vestigial-like protein 4 isoform X2 [Ptychodera flava]|uniref:transcription cofactor vestigial-like protein 4 isoform X2 n=1 Tax=Ptychodera flava TaxID=63121 RepID=UPI00396A47E0